MPAWTLRPVTPADKHDVIKTLEASFGARSGLSREVKYDVLAGDGTVYVATSGADPSRIAGAYARMPITLSMPGRGEPVVAEGVTWVVVRPDCRRQGLLSAMMEHHVRDATERNVPWSLLWATEPGIYGRFGFAPMGQCLKAELTHGALEKVTKPYRGDYTYTLHDVTAESVSILHDVWAAAQRHSVGMLRWESHALTSSYGMPSQAHETSPDPQIAVLRQGSKAVAAAMVRRTPSWEESGPNGSTSAHLLVSTSAQARVVLAHYLSSFDLYPSTSFWPLRRDDEVVAAAGDPKSAKASLTSAAWIRPMNVPAALTSRRYSAPFSGVVRVAGGKSLPDTTVRWEIDSDGEAQVVETDASPDVTLAASALARVMMGTTPHAWRGLAEVGVCEVTEHVPGIGEKLAAALACDRHVDPLVMF